LSTRHTEWARRDHMRVKQRLRDSALKRLVGAFYDQLGAMRDKALNRP
jgi:hypothetical protein